MKKVLLLILSLCLFAPIMIAQTGNDDPIGIVIGESGGNGVNPSHHAPILIPIQAVYYPSISTIMVRFLFDLGTISVEIENETTGNYMQTTVNATQGMHPFVISGSSGLWLITFTFPSGEVLTGSFEI